MTMSATKLWTLVVISWLAVACSCGAEDASRKTAEEELVYKNHRTSKNDTVQTRLKYPVYPAQVYANLSNAKDFTTTTTEEQDDTVLVYITPTPSTGNRRTKPADKTTVASTTQQTSAAAPPVYFITSKSVQSSGIEGPTALSHKTPVYSTPSPLTNGPVDALLAATKETADFRASPPTVTVDETTRKRKFNGTKTRRVLKAQHRLKQAGLQKQQQPMVLLSATSTTAPPSSPSSTQLQVFVTQPRNVTSAAAASAPAPAAASPAPVAASIPAPVAAPVPAHVPAPAPAPAPATYPVIAKVANSSGPSKPFATVLVPKQMLEGNSLPAPQQDYSSSFRPIAAPAQYALYRPAVDTNTVVHDNKRVSSEAKTQASVAKAQAGVAKAQAGVVKAQVSAAKAQTGVAKAHAGVAKAHAGVAKVHVGAAKAQTDVAKVQTGATKSQAGAMKSQAGANKLQTGVFGAPKLTKFGFMKQSTYKVEEYVPGDEPTAVVYDKRFNGDGSYKNDRSDQTVFMPSNDHLRRGDNFYMTTERRDVQEKPARMQQFDVATQWYDQQPKAQELKQKPKYGYSLPDLYSYELQKQSFKAADAQQQQFREYYPATEVTPTKEAAAAASHPKYDAAGKFEMQPVAVEMTAGPPFVTNIRPTSAPSSEVNNRPTSAPSSDANSRPASAPSFEGNGRPASEPSFDVNNRPSLEKLFEVNSKPASGPSFDMNRPASGPSFDMNRPASGPSFDVNRPASGPSFDMNIKPTSVPWFDVSNRQSSGPSFDVNNRQSFEVNNRQSSGPLFDVNNRQPFEIDSRPSFEMNSRPSFESNSRPLSVPPKEFIVSGGGDGGPPTFGHFTSANAGKESSGVPEVFLSDVNSKDLLKSLLLDMIKGKQLQSETAKTPKLSTKDEATDSYFKASRPNVDLSVDNYDIETDMSCNLRSTKYITDGQCVTTKPVVEAVCADRCLVYASSTSPFGVQRQRSSMSANQQVEALHCVNGDSKLLRVQLHCRDGNTLNNVIKVVTNCRCKLHQIQPQIRSNSQPLHQAIDMINPDIMSIAGGKF